MNKPVQCPACGEGYTIDLEKYGGKKIRCKKCQAVIAVPTAAEAQGEFEVIEEAAAPAPTPNAPPGVPPSILQRHRMASLRGMVNIALLQRSEASRKEIRRAFLAVHGTEQARSAAAREKEQALAQLDEQVAQHQQVLSRLKDTHARALAFRPKSVTEYLSKERVNFFKDTTQADADEKVYEEAVGILGKPVPPAQTDLITGLFNQSERQRDAKIRTIKEAMDLLHNTNLMLQEERREKTEELEKTRAALAQKASTQLAAARGLMVQGKFAEAVGALEGLLRTAPADALGPVLVSLSQCAYLSGNASHAARHIQDAICFGASAPVDMDEGYNDMWAKASAGLPRS